MIQAVAAINNTDVSLGEAIGHEYARNLSEDIAAWLTEAGRRAWHPAQTPAKTEADRVTESSGQLVGDLEELAGRKFISREDIRRYVDEFSTQAKRPSQAQRRRQVLRDAVLTLLPAVRVHPVQLPRRQSADCTAAVNHHFRPGGGD
jgi:hypothetical protein